MTACHYTPSQIAEMEMLDILSLFAYWKDWPPTHEILRLVHGTKSPGGKGDEKKKSVDPNDPSGIGGLIHAFPNGFVKD
jgi:hypothetical protein